MAALIVWFGLNAGNRVAVNATTLGQSRGLYKIMIQLLEVVADLPLAVVGSHDYRPQAILPVSNIDNNADLSMPLGGN